MNNAVTKAPEQRTLPGLMPDREASTLVDGIVLGWNDVGPCELRRELTTVERESLQTRCRDLDVVLRAVSYSGASREKVAQAIAAMFVGFPSMRFEDAQGTVAAYLMALEDEPEFAVLAALKDVMTGRIKNPHDADRAPSSGKIAEAARRHAAAATVERVRITKAINGRVTTIVDEAERAAVGEGFAILAADLHKQDEERIRELEKKADASAAANRDRQIIHEYKSLGIEPIYAAEGGMLLSVSLARQLGKVPPAKPTVYGDRSR